MEKNLILAGYGGQGVLFFGVIVANAALLEGKETTWMPSYGAEMRGGHANCSVIISSSEIGSPIIDEADIGVFLNSKAYDKFRPQVAKDGIIIANSSLIKDFDKSNGTKHFLQPFSDMGEYVLNSLVLGNLVATTNVVKKESAIKALEEISKKKNKAFVDKNINSFMAGYNLKTL